MLTFEAEPGEVEAIRREAGEDVIIEPRIFFERAFVPLAHHAEVVPADSLGGGSGDPLRLTIHGDGRPLPGATVTLHLRLVGGAIVRRVERSDGRGRVSFSHDAASRFAESVVVEPAGGFWSRVEYGPIDRQVIDCPRLPNDGPTEWWHRSMGVTNYRATRGAGIRIGVCDTGCGPNAAVAHVASAGAFVDGVADPDGGGDVDDHGTHVVGIIAAKKPAPGHYAGFAAGADVWSARVFPRGGLAANDDLTRAIEHLSRHHRVDLINLSLGGTTRSLIVRDAILDARERGTLCVSAAGNHGGLVGYPAAEPEVAAVAALGRLGTTPAGTLSATRLPTDPRHFGDDGVYLANFSCHGEELTCAAPGVGYVSTIPAWDGSTGEGSQHPYAAMDGTSMAAPAVTGLLAVMLAEDKHYLGLPRDLTRTEWALRRLRQGCRDVGLPPSLQGFGVPTHTPAS